MKGPGGSGCVKGSVFGQTVSTYDLQDLKRRTTYSGYSHYWTVIGTTVNSGETDVSRWSVSSYEYSGNKDFKVKYSTTLSQPFTASDFRQYARRVMPDYSGVYGYASSGISTISAQMSMDSGYVYYSKIKFKFVWGSNVKEEDKYPVRYVLVFIPNDDPGTEDIDESEDVKVISSIDISWNGKGQESSSFEIDPGHISVSRDGTYRLMEIRLEASVAANPGDALMFGKVPIRRFHFPGSLAPDENVAENIMPESLVIYHNEVINSSYRVVPFEIRFFASSTLPVKWVKAGGSTSNSSRGDLEDFQANQTKLKIAAQGGSNEDPFDGGIYQYVAIIGSGTSDNLVPVQIWFPVAGPNIDKAFMAEIERLRLWGEEYRDHLHEVRVPHVIAQGSNFPRPIVANLMRLLDMRALGRQLDWYGAPLGELTPVGGPPNEPPMGTYEHRLTLGGVVLDWPKRNNILYGYIGRQMGIASGLLDVGPNLVGGSDNTPDGADALASYGIGYRLFEGEELSDVMKSVGSAIHPVGSWAAREWPSFETNDAINNVFELKIDGKNLMDQLLVIDGYYE